MNDRQDPYGQIYGYDAYGRPLYQPEEDPQPYYQQPQDQSGYQQQPYPQHPDAPQHPQQQGYPGYEPYQQPQGYQDAQGYDGYQQQAYDWGSGQQPRITDTYPPHEGYPQGYGYDTGEQPPVAAPPAGAPDAAAGGAPVQGVPQQRRPEAGYGAGADPEQDPAAPGHGPGGEPGAEDKEYATEQFAFIEEENTDSEDVIDWLKFSESRTERREEAKRRGRGRVRLLVIVLVLALIGGVGALWATDRLPFLSGPGAGDGATEEAQKRDVIIVHLRELDGETASTALLVANETTGGGYTVLLPGDLTITPDGGTTTLGQAVTQEAAGSVREAAGALLGADIKGTWRLGTPYLETLVDLLGGITVTTDVEVPGAKEDEPVVPLGDNVSLSGEAAVAYATHREPDEPENARLERFGQVLAGILAKMPTGEDGATRTIHAVGLIADPSLSEEELALSLAQLGGYAQDGAYETVLLPVETDGTLSAETAEGLVMDVLGGTVVNADPGAALRISVTDATGGAEGGEMARVALINGGFSVVDSRTAEEASETSRVMYGAEEHRETALEAARTLGLPEDVVGAGNGAPNADVTIILGEDYGE
ncbi:LCP family protein [Streptomyces sp. NPDC059853]|uniref:LCP family protein n=1 Tax=Streptomyces sp. NPDC059853 TaxID=3346973 RepID=UPI0036644825